MNALLVSGQDNFRRLQRGAGTAAKSEALAYLRENGIERDQLTESEFNQLIQLIEDPQRRNNTMHNIVKQWIFRQMRHRHNPSITARYLGTSFNETIQYFVIFSLYLMLLVGTDCAQETCPIQTCSGCAALRTVLTLHLLYYDLKWLYKLMRLLWQKSVQILNLARQVPEYIQVGFEVFIGWRIMTAVCGIVFSIYLVPMAVPEMSVSSLCDDYYENVYEDMPGPIRLLTRIF